MCKTNYINGLRSFSNNQHYFNSAFITKTNTTHYKNKIRLQQEKQSATRIKQGCNKNKTRLQQEKQSATRIKQGCNKKKQGLQQNATRNATKPN